MQENGYNVTVEKRLGERAKIISAISGGRTFPFNRETYVTVRSGTALKKRVLVYVEEEESLKNYRAMNIEDQYMRMGPGETVTLPVYYGPRSRLGKRTGCRCTTG